jgi:hypothetical protein
MEQWFQRLKLEYHQLLSKVVFNVSLRCYTKVAGALLDGGAYIDFATPPRHGYPFGWTPLMAWQCRL